LEIPRRIAQELQFGEVPSSEFLTGGMKFQTCGLDLDWKSEI